MLNKNPLLLFWCSYLRSKDSLPFLGVVALSWGKQVEININDQQNHHLPAPKQLLAQLGMRTGCLSSCEPALHTCTLHPLLNSNPAWLFVRFQGGWKKSKRRSCTLLFLIWVCCSWQITTLKQSTHKDAWEEQVGGDQSYFSSCPRWIFSCTKTFLICRQTTYSFHRTLPLFPPHAVDPTSPLEAIGLYSRLSSTTPRDWCCHFFQFPLTWEPSEIYQVGSQVARAQAPLPLPQSTRDVSGVLSNHIPYQLTTLSKTCSGEGRTSIVHTGETQEAAQARACANSGKDISWYTQNLVPTCVVQTQAFTGRTANVCLNRELQRARAQLPVFRDVWKRHVQVSKPKAILSLWEE